MSVHVQVFAYDEYVKNNCNVSLPLNGLFCKPRVAETSDDISKNIAWKLNRNLHEI